MTGLFDNCVTLCDFDFSVPIHLSISSALAYECDMSCPGRIRKVLSLKNRRLCKWLWQKIGSLHSVNVKEKVFAIGSRKDRNGFQRTLYAFMHRNSCLSTFDVILTFFVTYFYSGYIRLWQNDSFPLVLQYNIKYVINNWSPKHNVNFSCFRNGLSGTSGNKSILLFYVIVLLCFAFCYVFTVLTVTFTVCQ